MRNKMLAAAVMMALGVAGVASADETTTFSGRIYTDFTSISTDTNGTTVDPNGYGIDVKRFYFGVDHKFDDQWAMNVTTDFNYVSADASKETQVFIKKAYMQYKFDNGSTLRVGSADLPWVPYVEGVYGLRFVENTLTDRTKFGTSADWGLHLNGGTAGSGLNYAVSMINGGGYKNPTRSKSMDFEARVGYETSGFVFAGGYYTGKQGKDTETTPAINTASRVDFLAAYKTDAFSAGVEYFQEDNFGRVLSATEDSADGYSVFGRFNFSEGMSLFARYDSTDPSKDLAPTMQETYYNVGVTQVMRKNVTLAYVYKSTKVENGTFNGIGGTTDGTQDEFGVWAELRF